MYKFLCALLVGISALALTSGSKEANASPEGPPFPIIVAKGRLVDQTPLDSPNPRTIFVPAKTGLYRLSAYITLTTQSDGAGDDYILSWTDDAGPETSDIITYGGPPPAYNVPPGGAASPGNVVTFEAVAGTPVTYYISGSSNVRYSLYYVVERLE